MIKAIVVTEGDYAETLEFRDVQHLNDFSDGFSCGAGHYGAGDFGIYTIDDVSDADSELADMIRAHLAVTVDDLD
jgi:hypothetical protein